MLIAYGVVSMGQVFTSIKAHESKFRRLWMVSPAQRWEVMIHSMRQVGNGQAVS